MQQLTNFESQDAKRGHEILNPPKKAVGIFVALLKTTKTDENKRMATTAKSKREKNEIILLFL